MRIVDFAATTKTRIIERLSALAGPGGIERRIVPFDVGSADICIARGGALDKAALSHMTMHDVVPPGETTPRDYMVFQLEIFPASPICPMGHLNTEWSLTGIGPYHMNLDLFPALENREAVQRITDSMDAVARVHGQDPALMRSGLDEHYHMAHWDRPLAAMAGCKLMNLGNDRLDLFIAAYTAFLDSYLDLLAQTRAHPSSSADTAAKLRRNGKWLEYLTLKDVAVKMGLGVGLPPEVIIDLSFPPSATF